jgi:hypothetical protein
MINPNTKLTIYHDNGGSFEDHSREAFDFSRDAFNLTLSHTASYLYVGFYKPVNSVFIQLNTVNTNANLMAGEFFNGSTWSPLRNLFDDTKGFTRSGFITWDRNQTSQASNSINGNTMYWVRFRPSVTHSNTVVQAINFVFTDDNDLSYEVPEITDTNHLAGKTSHILTHVAVRNEILQSLINKDYSKTNPTTGLKEDLTCWDILDVHQLKQACIFLALSKIYFNFSDSIEDKYYQKYKDYYSKFKSSFELSQLALDSNDDGIEDDAETQTENFSIKRITR